MLGGEGTAASLEGPLEGQHNYSAPKMMMKLTIEPLGAEADKSD
jgi:hypothetical protein